jgi:subtilisin family serine protease
MTTRRPAFTLALAAAALLAAATATAETVGVIVELAAPPAAVAAHREGLDAAGIAARRQELASRQDDFLAGLAAAGIPATVRTRTVADAAGAAHTVPLRTTLVFNGLALDLPAALVERVAAMPEVAAVHRVRARRLLLDRSVAYIRAPEVYGAVPELGPYDDLREGYEGHGIHVAVIDSGIDWSHPAFGGDATPPRFGVEPPLAAIGRNPKVVYYLPLADGVADDFGHGTHVAATIAGYLTWAPGPDGLPQTADDVPVHGVAPQARLLGYKACNAAGACLNEDILLAIEDAVSPTTVAGFAKPVAHVINMSLGGSGGPDDPEAVASANASLLGTVVVAAAGNDGPGPATLGSPAAGRHVIAVAAATDPGVFPHRIDALSADGSALVAGPIAAILAPDSNLGQELGEPLHAHYVFAGLADSPDQVPPAVAGNVCLVERGSTAEAAGQGSGLFANKAANCQARGAVAVVVFNDEPGELAGVLAPAAVPVLTISREDGLLLRDDLGFDTDGVSLHPLRLGPPSADLYRPGIAGFSSRGPVAGFGQVKPDVAAPGVEVLAATTAVGAPVVSMQDPSRYTSASGTSMATPHVAGAAALVKQAHPGWSPAMIRAALVNTATEQRDAAGRPLAAGAGNDVYEQGGGLADVAAAVAAPALVAVDGDGEVEPALVPGHSFGRRRMLGTGVGTSVAVDVRLADLTGAGGTYHLGSADNRGLAEDGVAVSFDPPALALPPGASATTRLTLTVDGSRLGGEAARDLMGYAVASDGAGASLRLPFVVRATPEQPAVPANGTAVEVALGTVLVGDQNLGADTGLAELAGVSYVDVPFFVHPETVEVEGLLEFAGLLSDLDLLVLDPDGGTVTESRLPGGPESVRFAVDFPGEIYVYRVSGWLDGPQDFTLTTTRHVVAPPAVAPFAGDFVDGGGRVWDFDGDLTVRWEARGGELGFAVERSVDGGAWAVVGRPAAGATSLDLRRLADGDYRFRVSGLFPGRTGTFTSRAGAEAAVTVATRVRRNITRLVETAVSDVSFAAGVFQLDLALTNTAEETWLPTVVLEVRHIRSASGTVVVANADDGGTGIGHDPATFDYSHRLGADDLFGAGEVTGTRTLRFADPAAELFTFVVRLTGHMGRLPVPAGGEPAGEEAGGEEEPALGAEEIEALLELTANPLTRQVVVRLVDLL